MMASARRREVSGSRLVHSQAEPQRSEVQDMKGSWKYVVNKLIMSYEVEPL